MGRVSSDEHDTGLRAADLDPERPRPIETPWGTFALYCVGAEVLASQAFCPHLLGPLFQGTRAGETITCPWHGWRFSLRSGERVDAPAGEGPSPPLVRLGVSVGAAGTLVLRRLEHE